MATPEEAVHNRFSAEFFSAVDKYEGPKTAEGLQALALKTLEGMQFRFLDGDVGQLNTAKQHYISAVMHSFGNISDASASRFIADVQSRPQAAEQGWAREGNTVTQRPDGTIMNEADEIAATVNGLSNMGIDLKKNAQLEAALSSSAAQRAVGGGSVPNIPSAPQPASGMQR